MCLPYKRYLNTIWYMCGQKLVIKKLYLFSRSIEKTKKWKRRTFWPIRPFDSIFWSFNTSLPHVRLPVSVSLLLFWICVWDSFELIRSFSNFQTFCCKEWEMGDRIRGFQTNILLLAFSLKITFGNCEHGFIKHVIWNE